MEEWQNWWRKVKFLNRFNRKNNDFIRRFLRGVRTVEMDATGRLNIPRDLMAFAGIGRKRLRWSLLPLPSWKSGTVKKMKRQLMTPLTILPIWQKKWWGMQGEGRWSIITRFCWRSPDGLNIQPGRVYVDVTFGGGGPPWKSLSDSMKRSYWLSIKDKDALKNAIDDPRFMLINENFRISWKRSFCFYGHTSVDGILGDFRVSSHQFDEPDVGGRQVRSVLTCAEPA